MKTGLLLSLVMLGAWTLLGCRVRFTGYIRPDAAVDAAAPGDSSTSPDAARDTGVDAALPDAALPDAALPDAALPDAAPPDAAPPDASVHVCPPTGGKDCSQGPGTGENDQCVTADRPEAHPSCFLSNVQTAVSHTVNNNPSWFDTTVVPTGCPYILEETLFVAAVLAHLANQNLCAMQDPNAGDEITVKFNNSFDESFDIIAENGCARWGSGIYTAYCAPSWW